MSTIHAIVHNAFPHGDAVEPFSEQDMACFAEIRDVLKKHDKLDRFGLTLLHKHFDIEEDEMLVETVNEETRTQIIQPMKKSAVAQMDGQILETSWTLKEGDAVRGCRIACYTQGGSHHRGHVYSSN